MNPPNLSRLVHDMRSHLAAIVGCAELLETQPDRGLEEGASARIAQAVRALSAALDELVEPTLDPKVQRDGLTAAVRRRRRRVVVADDDPLMRTLLRTTLPANLFDVVEARNGFECIDAVDRAWTDLVILDWAMPRLSGERTLGRLRAARPDLPVIVLTGSVAEDVPAAELGADVLLRKPFSPLELLRTIEELLGRTAQTLG